MTQAVLILSQGDTNEGHSDLGDALRRLGIRAHLIDVDTESVRIPLAGHKLLETCDIVYLVGSGPAVDAAHAVAQERDVALIAMKDADMFAHVAAIGNALGRDSLDEYLVASATGPAALDKWKAAHPADPLAQRGFALPKIPKLRRANKTEAMPDSPVSMQDLAPHVTSWRQAMLQGLILALCHTAAIIFVLALVVAIYDPPYLDLKLDGSLALAGLAIPIVFLVGGVANRFREPLRVLGIMLVEFVTFVVPGFVVMLALLEHERFSGIVTFGLIAALVIAGTIAVRAVARRLYDKDPKWTAIAPFVAAPLALFLGIQISEYLPTRDDAFTKFLAANSQTFSVSPKQIYGQDVAAELDGGWRTMSKVSGGWRPFRTGQDQFFVPLSKVAPEVERKLTAALADRSGRLFLDASSNYIDDQDISALGEPVLNVVFSTDACRDMNPCAIPKSLELLWPKGTLDGTAERGVLSFSIRKSLDVPALADNWGYKPEEICGFDPRSVAATRLVTDVCWGRVAKIMGKEKQIDPYWLLPYSETSLKGVLDHWASKKGWFNEQRNGRVDLKADFARPFAIHIIEDVPASTGDEASVDNTPAAAADAAVEENAKAIEPVAVMKE